VFKLIRLVRYRAQVVSALRMHYHYRFAAASAEMRSLNGMTARLFDFTDAIPSPADSATAFLAMQLSEPNRESKPVSALLTKYGNVAAKLLEEGKIDEPSYQLLSEALTRLGAGSGN